MEIVKSSASNSTDKGEQSDPNTWVGIPNNLSQDKDKPSVTSGGKFDYMGVGGELNVAESLDVSGAWRSSNGTLTMRLLFSSAHSKNTLREHYYA